MSTCPPLAEHESLAGDVRRVPGLERRLAEAARLGFTLALVPFNNRNENTRMPKLHKLDVKQVATVAEALALLKLTAGQRNS